MAESRLGAGDDARWQAEHGFLERELALKEREFELSRDEAATKRHETARARFASPLVVAIFAAAIAAAGNALVAFVNGQQTRRVEEVRAEAGRILEMIKTGDPETAAENLRFLAAAGLIADPERRAAIERFLAARAPGEGPALPTNAGRELARPSRELAEGDTLREVAPSVGRLLVAGQDVCTAVLVGSGLLIVPDFCLIGEDGDELQFLHRSEGVDSGQNALWTVRPDPEETIEITGDGFQENARLHLLALSATTTPPRPARLLARAPQPGEPVAALFFLGGTEQLALRDEACAVAGVTSNAFSHPCVMGGGSSGAPIFSGDGAGIIGIHLYQREDGVQWAIRTDRIIEGSTILAGPHSPLP